MKHGLSARHRTLNRQLPLATILFVIASAAMTSACSSSSEPGSQATAGLQAANDLRNIDEMMRAKFQHQRCRADGDCPLGTHCTDSNTCDYQCISDEICGSGQSCNDRGECGPHLSVFVATTDPSCSTETRAQIIADLEALFLKDEPDRPKCHDDTTCPCGSFCDRENGFCDVECVDGSTSGNLVCTDAGQVCDTIGRCVTNTDPGPSPQLILQMTPDPVTANTFTAPVLVPVTVSVDAVSADVVVSPHPAPVLYHFVGIDDPQLPPPNPPPDPSTLPKVKCAAGDALATSCTINGGWTFDTAHNGLHSATKTIWVQLPKSTTAATWNLKATSEWAADPRTVSVQAAPVAPTPAIPGHYQGILKMTSAGAAIAAQVDAFITDNEVAIVDASRTLLGDGHALFARDPLFTASLGWLTGDGTSHYSVTVRLGAVVQDAVSGHLEFPGSTITVGETPDAALTLSLNRLGDLDIPTCGAQSPCPPNDPNHPENDVYCDTSFGRCLPGDGPAPGNVIDFDPDSPPAPDSTLPSTQVKAWASSVASMAPLHPGALQPGIVGIESAYCANDSGDGTPPFWNLSSTILGFPNSDPTQSSLDRQCRLGTTDYPQKTFRFADRQKEVITASQTGADIALVDACSGELKANPSAALSTNDCVSLGRFFLALRANVAAGFARPGGSVQQRLVWQLVRQWLGVNSYVASTTVRLQPYHDVVDATSVPRSQTLGDALDLMETSLKVLLDPTIRGQWAEGSALADVVAAPDYRPTPRPKTRWTFNSLNQTNISTFSVPDVEGSSPLSLSYSGDTNGRIYLGNSDLQSSGFGGTRTCVSSAPIRLDNQSYTISAALNFIPFNGISDRLFSADAGSQHLFLDASTSDWGHHVVLTLSDPGHGATVTFTIPWFPNNWGHTSFLALVAELGAYRLYVANPADQPTIATYSPTSVVGAPSWPGAATVTLACQNPGANACSSFDLFQPGDGLDHTVTNGMVVDVGDFTDECEREGTRTRCLGTFPSDGNCAASMQSDLSSRTTTLRGMGATDAEINAITVSARAHILQQSGTPGVAGYFAHWNCELTYNNYPNQVFAFKPVCGQGGLWDTWDEVSFSNEPISLREFTSMANQYNYTSTNESLLSGPTLPFDGSKDEQAAGLPVYILEAANAHLELLANYVTAEDDVVYADCYAGRSSTELPIARARAGRNLRLAIVLQREAARLAALSATSPAWLPRYQAALQQFTGRISDVQVAVERLRECNNSLNIGDDQVPLYVGLGKDTSPTSRFYAASDFLVGLAESETLFQKGTAALLLDSARTSYINQRNSSFQTNRGAGSTEKTDRVNALTVNYEDQLKQYCGAAPGDLTGGHPLLDGLRSGALIPETCYLKLEDTVNCSVDVNGKKLDATTPFQDIPDKCIRGKMGELVMTIKSAAIDADNALRAIDRATQEWDVQVNYCNNLQQSVDAGLAELDAHNTTMRKLAEMRAAASFVAGISKTVAAIGAAAVTGGAGALGVIGAVGEGLAASAEADLDIKTADENASYAVEVQKRQGDQQLMACKATADQQKFSIDAATDASKRAAEQSSAAVFSLRDSFNTVKGIAGEAGSQLAFEDTINRTPPQFHYWLDATIAEYQRHMAFARRLTYLALRAFEYENQSDTGWRGRVLTARVPADLQGVLDDIAKRSVPLANGAVPKPTFPSNVWSLKSDIMKLQDVNGKTAAQRFNEILLANPVFSGTGTNRHLFGYGIPFSIKPGESWNNAICDERLWRFTPLVVSTGGPPTDKTVVINQKNVFGSQVCTEEHPVKITRINQNANLLTGDTQAGNFATPDTSFSASILLNLGNSPADVQTLSTIPDTDTRLDSSLAGRELYADYVLIIPLCDPAKQCTTGYTLDKLHTVTDVLIRLDVAAGDNQANLPHPSVVIEGPPVIQGGLP